MKYILLIFSLFFVSTLVAQKPYWKESKYALVYKITNEQAEELAKVSFERKIADSEAAKAFNPTNEPIDTIFFSHPTNVVQEFAPTKNKYPLGHYVMVRGTGEYLEYKFLANYDVGIVPIIHKKRFLFHVVDTMGNFIKPDKVTLDGKTLKYDKEKQRYEFRKFKKSRLLVVEYNGQKAFFEVDANHGSNDYYRNNTNWLVRTWDRIIYANLWRSPLYVLGNTWRRIYMPFKDQWEVKTYGYVTTNQPKYLPQDTVKIKAYITRDNNIAYNCPLTLKITNYGNYQFKTTVKPTSKGNYIFEFPLGDTLQLDKQYQVEFWKGKRRLMQTYFNYEDYQLDEITYDLRADQKNFKRYEPVVFYAEGKDQNGQNVMDGDVELTATISNIKAFHAKEVYIPDTLFHYKGALDLGDAMKFPLSKEILPMADFTVNVYAVFTNSNGELHHKNLSFNIISDSTFIEMSLNGDTLMVDYLVNSKSVSTVAKLEFTLDASNFYVEKTVQLPYKEVINPVFSYITARVENDVRTLKLNNNEFIKTPTFELIQTTDSVFMFGYNPSALEVNYEIYRINRRIEKNSSNNKLIIWKDKIRKKTSYRIDYEYVMNGEGRQGSKPFNYAANQLTIKIDQPTVVQPGQTIDIKIKVKNSKNRDAKNINLVAGAINTQFGNSDNWKYSAPFYGKVSKRKDVPNYNYYNKNLKYNAYSYYSFNWVGLINNRFRKDLELEKELYYKLLFPKNGTYQTQRDLQRDSNVSLPEFAPFIVKDGKFQPIYLIYANRELVYYHDTKTTYSFKGRNGYNQLIIRGKDFELQIDSVYLTKGEQVIFSIDLNNLPKNVYKYERSELWTESEKSLLRKSIFTYQRTGNSNKVYVWQNDVIYYSQTGESEMNFGPFTPNQQLHLVRKNEFHNQFLFEPSYKYQIEKERERLYFTDAFPSNQKLQLTNLKARTDLGEQILLSRNIPIFDKPYVEPLIQTQLRAAFSKVRYASDAGMVRYRTNPLDSLIRTTLLINKRTNKIDFYSGSRTSFRGLKADDYTIYGYTKWGNYFAHDITIHKDTMVYEFIEELKFQTDKNLDKLKSLLALKDIVIPNQSIIGQTKPNAKPTKKITYSGVTYPISGKVTDDNGEAIMFATVLIKGTTIGTTTDLDGNYTIQVPKEIKNPVLTISYIGFSTKEITLNNTNTASTVDILMEEGQVLEEVVVVGYSSVRKTEAVGAMSIEVDQVAKLRSKKVSGIIARTPGVMGEVDLEIRGSRSDKNDYYIDGIKVSADTVNFDELQASSKIRSRFQDYAFWQPNLITDRNGEVTFRVTYPDDITAYKTFVLGMDRKQNFGIATKTVKSQKTALAQLAVPRFMIQGDKANVIGKSLNYSSDSLRIKSSFVLDNSILQTNDFWLKNVEIETAQILANTDKDTLQLTYKMEHSKFFDGEKRPIPIYRKGVEETVGSFNILTGDTTITLKFDRDKGNVKIYAQTDILEVLLQDIQYLIDYPYGCNEQTASRLLALLMNKQIKAVLGQEKPDDKPIVKMVKRLEKSQNDDGSWGWWTGSRKDYWMTNYVLKALHAADTSGYKSASYETGLRFITNSLEEIPTSNLMNSMELLSDIQQNADYEKYLNKIDSTVRYNDYYNQLRMIKIKQQQNLSYDLTVLDTLEKSTLFGNIFYDIDNYRYRYWYSNHFNLTNLVYQVLRNENKKQNGEYAVKLAAIRGYFLEKRTRYGWRNTFTTAQILSTILPDVANASNRVKPQLIIKGNTTETVTEFPFETTFYANTPLEIQKTGTSTVYLTGYQQFWNEKPKPKSDIFELKSTLYQEGKTVNKLKTKTPAKMIVTLEVKKEADYVMVEVPIPAGCSYGEKNIGVGHFGSVRHLGHLGYKEVHREYFREKTCVFYQNLPVGTYTIEINLEPRFTGEYTINPAKAEQMYFPVFYGRNGMEELKIDN